MPTLTELFTEIADSIRSVKATNTDDTIQPVQFPDYILKIAPNGRTATDIQSIPNFSNPSILNTTAAITIKAATIYDGYIFSLGNDSAGDLYKLYGEVGGTLTCVKLGNSRYYPATTILCDGTYVWIGNSSGSYNNRVLLRQEINAFKSTSTTINYYTNSNMSITCGCSAGDNYHYIFGSRNNDKLAWGVITNGSTSTNLTYYNDTYDQVTCCCEYRGMPVAITSSGYVLLWLDPSKPNFRYLKTSFLAGTKFCMNVDDDYLIAVKVANGNIEMYITEYPTIDKYYDKITITLHGNVSDIISLFKYNNSIVVMYTLSNGEIKVYTNNLIYFKNKYAYGLYGIPMHINEGFTPRIVVSDNTNMCLLSDNGSTVEKTIFTGT